MTRPRIFVPRDAAALVVGSDDVDRAIVAALRRRQIDAEIVRTGSRGLFWLEPMIEVASGGERVAYGPVAAGDVEGLFDAGFLDGKSHALRLGQPETILFLKRQQRLIFARCGIVDRLSLADYYATLIAWLRTPIVTILMVLLLIALFYHTALGVQVVLEDYIHSGMKIPALLGMRFGCFALAAAGILATLRIAFRS
jgi:succinate dehydrogenase hydrophobic membrane anchor protein